MALSSYFNQVSIGSLKSNNTNTPLLFTPIQFGPLTLKNRILLAPMCQYSAKNGLISEYHTIHLGQYALYGISLLCCEATAVVPEGRISTGCTGLYNDEQQTAWMKLVNTIHLQSAYIGIQLGHAGRKASCQIPFLANGKVVCDVTEDGWPDKIYGPSPIPFNDQYYTPKEMSIDDIKYCVNAFKESAIRADKAGFDYILIHAAHGYLLSSFLSNLSNTRTDMYGGSLENRARFVIEVIDVIKSVWPANKALGIRISTTDWVDGGWDINQTIELTRLIAHKVDFIDCSSGGNISTQKITVFGAGGGPNYQVQFAEIVKKEIEALGLKTLVGGVGLITEPAQAEEILTSKQADVVSLGRQLLREPNWALRAARELNAHVFWPLQYIYAEVKLPTK